MRALLRTIDNETLGTVLPLMLALIAGVTFSGLILALPAIVGAF